LLRLSVGAAPPFRIDLVPELDPAKDLRRYKEANRQMADFVTGLLEHQQEIEALIFPDPLRSPTDGQAQGG
jgi:hypothetical protein